VELAGGAITSSLLAGSAAARRALAGMVEASSTLAAHMARVVSLRSSAVTGSKLVAVLMDRACIILIGTVRGISSAAGMARVSWALSGSISTRVETSGLVRLFSFIIRSGRSAVSSSLAAQSIISKASSAQAAIIRSHTAQALITKAKAGASGITKSVRGDSEF